MSVWGVVDIPAPGSGDQQLMVNVQHYAGEVYRQRAVCSMDFWQTAHP
jgi:hypothetical protein